ncbi:MAG: type II secretion system protein E [Parcubacteria group bacterium Athens1014_10]|nr:MAG: type II secretion system protein E [Parcubacteria group bacterium Athens1014_10]TSD05225.1 MAG: type II secretion system protein E [Parcubacteria group bacterium Athens0714_12]
MIKRDYQNKLLSIFLEEGLLSPDQINELKKESLKTKQSIEDLIKTKKLIKEDELLMAKSKFFNLPTVDLSREIIKKDVLEIIPKELAENYQMIAFGKIGNKLKVAIEDPDNLKAKEAIEFLARSKDLKVEYYLASKEVLSNILQRHEESKKEIEEALSVAEGKAKVVSRTSLKEKGFEEIIKGAPISKIISVILRDAVEGGASDVHIEPEGEVSRVRYRVDGVLRVVLTLPKYIHSSLISRIKVLANLKLDETRIPQDGRIREIFDNKIIDFRVSTFPLLDNEKAVMRILKTGEALTLEELGFWGKGLQVIERNIQRPSGLFLVTGPTGSGKTTSLYSVLNILNKESINIITLEDPIEYYLEGVNQSQVRPEIGFNFASGLRAILRQDPNVVMVGEIRDFETAELAIHAGLTGHIVLSTLHTNDTFGAVPRLIDMKIEPFLIASTLNIIIAQRLVRKICPDCKEEDVLPKGVIKEIYAEIENIPNLEKYLPQKTEKMKFYKGKGCSNCQNRGYQGRIAITEVLDITDEMKEIITNGCKIDEVKKEFKNQEMLSMKQDGIIKAIKGFTSLEEIITATRT